MLSEMSQPHKDKYCIFSLICRVFWGKKEHESKKVSLALWREKRIRGNKGR
jgi:hypothetical protein